MTQAQYRVVGFLGTDEVETLELAQALLAQKKVEFAASIQYAFSVNACIVDAAGNKSVFPCVFKANEPPPADFFEAFNYKTGVYTRFDDFQAAKEYVQALQTEYLTAADSSFMLQQQGQPVEGGEAVWVTLPA